MLSWMKLKTSSSKEEFQCQLKKNLPSGGLVQVLTVTENYMVPCLKSGIVVYIGEKEEYGNTLVLEQEDGIDVFYSNIETSGISNPHSLSGLI